MKRTDTVLRTVHVALDLDQLLVVHQALNEVCNALAVADFETRIGASREEVAAIMRQIADVVQQHRAQNIESTYRQSDNVLEFGVPATPGGEG